MYDKQNKQNKKYSAVKKSKRFEDGKNKDSNTWKYLYLIFVEHLRERAYNDYKESPYVPFMSKKMAMLIRYFIVPMLTYNENGDDFTDEEFKKLCKTKAL